MVWTVGHFLPHVGTPFIVPFDDGTAVELTLATVTRLPVQNFPGRTRDPFELRFHNPGPFGLFQNTYVVFHEVLGQIEMFLLPIGTLPGGGFVHQALYN